jgi:hypothetical protein
MISSTAGQEQQPLRRYAEYDVVGERTAGVLLSTTIYNQISNMGM